MDYSAIKAAAEGQLPAMITFLRDLISLPGESCREEDRAKRMLQEMQSLAFDECVIDPLGNVVGVIGSGEKLIVFEGHLDTVRPGPAADWSFDPQAGFEDEEKIGGRGASDQLGGIASAMYGAKLMQDLDLIPNGYRIMIVGTVQKEECDGLSWQYLSQESHVEPTFIISTEPTDGGIYRGQPGRMEMLMNVRGQDAVLKMAEILQQIETLNVNDAADDTEIKGLVKALDPKYNAESVNAHLLGKGKLTVLDIASPAHIRHAPTSSCTVTLDRRMTAGETQESCLEEIRSLPAVQHCDADISLSVNRYYSHGWTGYAYGMDLCFPAWICKESDAHVQALVQAHKEIFGEARTGAADTLEQRQEQPLVGLWTESADGVSLQGRVGIPCVGFGPGSESQVHKADEITWKQDLAVCAAVYAAAPFCYAQIVGDIVVSAPETAAEALVPVPRKVRFFKRLFGGRKNRKAS